MTAAQPRLSDYAALIRPTYSWVCFVGVFLFWFRAVFKHRPRYLLRRCALVVCFGINFFLFFFHSV